MTSCTVLSDNSKEEGLSILNNLLPNSEDSGIFRKNHYFGSAVIILIKSKIEKCILVSKVSSNIADMKDPINTKVKHL